MQLARRHASRSSNFAAHMWSVRRRSRFSDIFLNARFGQKFAGLRDRAVARTGEPGFARR
jgi:hypothetical protein